MGEAGAGLFCPDSAEEDGCEHVCEGDECYDGHGYRDCQHEHCLACGECGCAGYCDDYQTYNLRPAETGGTP